ncbi:MAG: M48 family metallopeptidase [Candidatus Kapaibacteriales bacterium]
MNTDIHVDKVIWANRKTFCLRINDNGNLIIIAPQKSSLDEIKLIVQRKSKWITRVKKSIEETKKFVPGNKLIDGEIFFYLGRKYSLKFYNGDEIKTEREFLLVPYYDPNDIKVKIVQWYYSNAEKIFLEYLKLYSRIMKVKYNYLHLSNAKTRWGSCSKNNRISLNWRLIMMPQSVIEYIVIHELAHILYPNHSKAFYKFVEEFCPNYKQQQRLLRDLSFLIKAFR